MFHVHGSAALATAETVLRCTSPFALRTKLCADISLLDSNAHAHIGSPPLASSMSQYSMCAHVAVVTTVGDQLQYAADAFWRSSPTDQSSNSLEPLVNGTPSFKCIMAQDASYVVIVASRVSASHPPVGVRTQTASIPVAGAVEIVAIRLEGYLESWHRAGGMLLTGTCRGRALWC
jgi:hypothetical protein